MNVIVEWVYRVVVQIIIAWGIDEASYSVHSKEQEGDLELLPLSPDISLWELYRDDLKGLRIGMTDEIREILDNLLSFSEQSNRLTECYQKLRSLKEKYTSSFVGTRSSCSEVIGNMMRLALLMKVGRQEKRSH